MTLRKKQSSSHSEALRPQLYSDTRMTGSYVVANRRVQLCTRCKLFVISWSRRSDLNRGPADYELSARRKPWTSADRSGHFA